MIQGYLTPAVHSTRASPVALCNVKALSMSTYLFGPLIRQGHLPQYSIVLTGIIPDFELSPLKKNSPITGLMRRKFWCFSKTIDTWRTVLLRLFPRTTVVAVYFAPSLVLWPVR